MSEPRQDEPPAIEGELVADSPDAPAPIVPEFDYTDDGVPNFDYVRDRIESRFHTSAASTDLAGDAPQVTSVEEQLAERERAGRDKLEEIRRSMRGE
jgi:phage shock protein A